MEYVNLNKLGVRVSRLGFGCMRFPTTPEGKIDEPRAQAMLDTAYKAGVNYFDTAYFYHKHTSEKFVGRALKAYPRDSFYLATKLPLSMIDSLDKAKEIYEGQFKTMDQEYFDFYLLHAINADRWQFVQESGILDFLVEEQKKGRIRHLGFSFHDGYEAFETIMTARDWDFCQIQFNYMDVDVQAGMKGYKLAQKLGVPVIVMEPVKGGSLATLTEDVASVLRRARPEWSLAAWAMRWVANLDNCKVILSGMSDEAQVEDNLATFASLEPMTQEDMQAIDAARDMIEQKTFVGCTNCKYCMPCPFGVDIPHNFHLMNAFAKYDNPRALKGDYLFMNEALRADKCQQCGACESACPQQIAIREKLQEIVAKVESL